MIKIMFVCHGNICRSPMAEIIFNDMVKKNGLDGKYCAVSSATSTEEIWNGIGNPVYPPAREELMKHGLSCEGKRAVLFERGDYGKYDLIIGMDSQNIRNIMRICGKDPEGKVYKLLSFAGEDRDVADPWYSGNFDITYEDVYRGCAALFKKLEENNHVR
ncbi:MAG: low molecular weight phosphotyrosine protein phosphatase [Ruminococcaceae bacterium]|nr:low molecular weight phosphotyrosine protein phosphatase [Oscillospiraceae bacterium]